MSLTTGLLALTIFQFKHFVCDFLLQTRWQIEGKRHYLGAGGIVHAGLHSLGSLFALPILGAKPAAYLLLPLAEFVVHYHIDFAKMQIDSRCGWHERDAPYWAVFGLDQLLHQMTYVAIVAVFAGVPG